MPKKKSKKTKILNKKAIISLVVPVYNEEEMVPIFYRALQPILKKIEYTFEIVFVDDGSSDGTVRVLKKFREGDTRIKILSLSRNFGKEAALSAGLNVAIGHAVIPMDVDMQDPPELLFEMVKEWKKGYDVVLATRRKRDEESWFKRKSAEWFYSLIRKLSSVKIPSNTGDYRLMDRIVVDTINRMPERTRFMKGLFAWAGFKTTQLYYDRPERLEGVPKQNYKKLIRLALDAIFSFSTVPLHVWTYLGVLVSLASIGYALIIISKTLLLGVDVPGYASLMTITLFLGGMQLLSLGIIGQYLGRIYREVKGRPLYVIRESYGIDLKD